MLTLLAALPVAVWCYLLAGRGQYWRFGRHTLPSEASLPEETPPRSVVAVIPARDEADVIGEAVTSLLAQELPVPLRIVLVDDGSSDGTAEAARQAAVLLASTHRVTVLPGRPLPSRWTGKLWAVAQGVQEVEGWAPDYLLLTDADIRHAPGLVASLLRHAEAHQFALASLMVRLATETAAEQLLIPAFVYFFLQLYPPAFIAQRRSRTAGAAGGCMLIQRTVLQDIGGVEAIRAEVIDDCALAALVKKNGHAVWLGLTKETVSLRSYGGFAGIERMISRSAFHQLRHSVLLLLATLLGLGMTYLAPVAFLFSRNRRRARLGGMALLLMSASYVPAVRFYQQRLAMAVMLPVVAVFYAVATLHSAVRYWQGTGGAWKGRVQDPRR